ncbi:IS5/IS1182 family transposase, partial [Pseudonocardiaceae bacterium YIM PH 21723]
MFDGAFAVMSYSTGLDVSNRTLEIVTRLLRERRQQINCRWRRLTPREQALITLAHLRKAESLRDLATGAGVSATTVWRYVRETIALLALRAPTLTEVLARYTRHRRAPVLLDGTLISVPEIKDARHYYSGKHKRYGVNVQVLADLRGVLLWVSAALPGSTNDITAARTHDILTTIE